MILNSLREAFFDMLADATGDSIGFSMRYIRAILSAVLVTFMLAVAYVYVGFNFVGASQSLMVDKYAFAIALAVGLITPIMYFFNTGDLSESVAVLTTMLWALFSGLEDIFVYLLIGKPLPSKMPWLNDSSAGFFAHLIGAKTVTDVHVYAWVLITGVINLYLIYWLYRIDA